MNLFRFTNRVIALIAATIAFATPSTAATFANSDFESYGHEEWGSPTSIAGTLLSFRYASVYASSGSILEVGVLGASGFSIVFDKPASVLAYLPDMGMAAGPLTNDYTNPLLTSTGAFGSNITALRLDVNFSDFSYLSRPAGTAFGDLVIVADGSGLAALASAQTLDPHFYGLTVRQFLASAEQALGGAVPYASYFNQTAGLLSTSFEFGVPSETAQRQLSYAAMTAVPEPATWSLFVIGLVFVSAGMRRSVLKAS